VTDPAAPKTSYIRGQFIYGKFVLTFAGRRQADSRPRGALVRPEGSVAKMDGQHGPKRLGHTARFQRLRRQVAKPDVTDNTEAFRSAPSRRGTSSLAVCLRGAAMVARSSVLRGLVSELRVGVLARFGAAGRWRGLAAGDAAKSRAARARRVTPPRWRRSSRALLGHARHGAWTGCLAHAGSHVAAAVQLALFGLESRTRSKRLFPAPGGARTCGADLGLRGRALVRAHRVALAGRGCECASCITRAQSPHGQLRRDALERERDLVSQDPAPQVRVTAPAPGTGAYCECGLSKPNKANAPPAT